MKKTKVISVVMSNRLGDFKGDYTLKFKKTKKGETEAVLTAPYLEWSSSESCEIAFNILTIKGRELECIEKYYFDENIFTILIKDHPYTIDMCDILYKVIPHKIYNQMISGTFIIKKDADPEIYEHYFQLEKENKKAIRRFLNEQKKLGIEIKSKTIMYARKLDIPTSSDDNISIILVNKLSKSDKYKVQIYLMSTPGKKQIFMESEFDDIYIAKKFFDSFEYKDKDVLFNKKHFESIVKDFTKRQFKNEAFFNDNTDNTDYTEDKNDIDKKIKKKIKKMLSSNDTGNFFEIFRNVLP